MHLDPPDISQNLEKAAAYHADHVAPRSVPDTEDEVGEQGDGEDGEVENISGQIRCVGYLRVLNRAELEGALLDGNGEIGRRHDSEKVG